MGNYSLSSTVCFCLRFSISVLRILFSVGATSHHFVLPFAHWQTLTCSSCLTHVFPPALTCCGTRISRTGQLYTTCDRLTTAASRVGEKEDNFLTRHLLPKSGALLDTLSDRNPAKCPLTMALVVVDARIYTREY